MSTTYLSGLVYAINIANKLDLTIDLKQEIKELLQTIQPPFFSLESYTEVHEFWEFMNGYFEILGQVNSPDTDTTPRCSIQSNDISFLEYVLKRCEIPGSILYPEKTLVFCSVNAIDFLGALKSSSSQFQRWLTYTDPSPTCHILKTDPNAVIPYKSRFSDVGLDLVIIKKAKQYTPRTTLYDTGIALNLPHGYYAEIVPRSSLSKTGYMLANSVGIIDNSYRGNLYIPLIKVDPEMPDLELPFRCCQLIFRKQNWLELKQVQVIETTTRGQGGFGSTG